MDTIQSILDAARKELLDLSLRNRLINYRPLKSKGVEVVDELMAEVFRILVIESKTMSFLPKQEKETEAGINEQSDQGESTHLLEQPEEEEEEEVNEDGIALRHVDVRLQTPYTSPVLQKRLLNTFYAARTYIEEQGVNILYIALGMLNWFESDRSEIVRKAPLILVPVELYRTSVRTRFHIRYTMDDLGDNVSLGAKLKTDFAIKLPIMPEAEDLNVRDYFDQIDRTIESRTRWSVDRKAIALGFFSFGRFLMYNDLDSDNWPDGAKPTAHPILRSLLQEGFSESSLNIPDGASIDSYVSPQDSFQVVDADSSQTLAILDVNDGRNLVIQGPPGTGKSQTITNLIAEALGQEKTVLFVAEKMAALEVVKRRLDEVGLGDACLELHSHKANKKAFLEELKRTVNLGQPRLDDFSADIQMLVTSRDRLNAYSAAVNTPIGDSGITPHYAFGKLIELRSLLKRLDVPSLDVADLEKWTVSETLRKLEDVEKMQALLGRLGVPVRHPFWGSHVNTFLPANKRKILETCSAAKNSINRLRSASLQLTKHLGLSQEESRSSLERVQTSVELLLEKPELVGMQVLAKGWRDKKTAIQEALETGSLLSTLHRQGDEWLLPKAWQHNVLHIRRAYTNYGPKWWRILSGEYRHANNEFAGLCREHMPKSIDARLRLVDKIIEAQRLQPVFVKHEQLMQHLFGTQWHGLESDWETLSNTTDWLTDLYQRVTTSELSPKLIIYLSSHPDQDTLRKFHSEVDIALETHLNACSALVESIKLSEKDRFGQGNSLVYQPLSDQIKIIDDWFVSVDKLQEMVSLNYLASSLDGTGLRGVIAVAVKWPHASEHLTDLVNRSRYEELVARAMKERPELNVFDASTHELIIDKFCEADQFSFQVKRAQLAFKHWEQLPKREAGGQLGILQREFAKRRRHLPIRKLMTASGNAIQAIKPVFMMGPLSIAIFIPPETLHFDYVIFDEASQVRPVESFGAILRGKQAVVVGDDRQLPPTSFFQQIVESEEEEESPTADLESVLGLFSAQGAPQRMLRWHYRSRHESLITVSNHEFYDNKLVLFPSPDAKRENLGVVYHYLPNTEYDRGRSRTNQKEALAVAQSVMNHANTKPHRTLGVAAFSISQMRAIQDQLEYLRRQDDSAEEFFKKHPHEPFFVKNLENVQGDERDIIFISVGYGRSADGKVTMNFGPLNIDGGERRLNVLITRARYRCELFTNITADDIDLNRSRARGVVALKRYLSYAKDGQLDVPMPTGYEADSPFEEAVSDALRKYGYQIVHQVGSAGFFIDLAVIDDQQPGRYLLGIECDGASYHTARSARDRDRLRQQVLEDMGWRIHRIWSTDWFRNPEQVLLRAINVIEEVREQSTQRTTDGSVPAQEAIPKQIPTVERLEKATLQTKIPTGEYQIADLRISYYGGDLHEVPVSVLSKWVREVVDIESPVHIDEVARRIANAYGVRRVGSRIRPAIRRAVSYAHRSKLIERRGDFLWKLGMTKSEVVRSHGDLPGYSRKIDQIAPEEIMLAVELVVENSLGMEQNEISQAACSLLGFGRTSRDMKNHLDRLVERMVSENRLVHKGDYLVIEAKLR